MLSVKKVAVVVVVAVSLFAGKEATPTYACSAQDGWTGCGQAAQNAWQQAQSNAQANYDQTVQGWKQAGEYTVVAGQWAVEQAGGYVQQGAASWEASNGGAWTLPSGASAPLQGAYDTATDYARNYSK